MDVVDDNGTSFRMGCQTITWGEGQRDQFPVVFADVAAAGYEGVEIGFRHLRGIDPALVKSLLDSHGLVLLATHLGGNLEDPSRANAERSILEEALDYVKALGCSTLIYSGLTFKDEAQFATDFERLNRAARVCQLQGGRLLYHNHNWEFAGDGRVIEAILSRADEALGLCPDVGWVAKAGVDVPAFLALARTRIGAVHFKDFAGPGSEVDTVVLGEGMAPLAATAEWMRDNLPPGTWAIAEQDRAELPPREAASRNAEYLKGLLQ